MALPDNITTVWVRGSIDGRGRVTFQPSPSALIDPAARRVIATSAPFVAVLDSDGEFAIELPATDDPDVQPTGWTYEVRTPTGRAFPMALPHATPVLSSPGDPLDGERVLDLSSVVPAPSASGGSVQVITPPAASPEEIASAVEGYLDEHPPDGDLAAQVDAIETEQEAHHIRLGALEAAEDDVPDLIGDAVTAHAHAATPHTAYDDLPSLRLLFENGLI